MSEKPQRQLVSKGKYVRVLGKKIGIGTAATIMATLTGISGLLILGGLYGVIEGAGGWNETKDSRTFLCGLCLMCVSAVGAWAAARFSILLFETAQAIKPVTPITDRTAHLLPLQETLVRGSEEPPIAQSDVLLRAATSGPETPPEQLLRPTVEE